MKVWVLIGADAYYPPADGTLTVFTSEETANTVLEELQEAIHWKSDSGAYEALREKYDFLPEYDHESYFLADHEVYEDDD